MPLFDSNYFTPNGMTQQSPSYVSTGVQQKTPQQQVQDENDYYTSFINSPLGQKWNTTQESAAAYARQQADAKMADDLKRLNATVADLQSQGRYREAEILKMQGETKIARERFQWEQQVKEQELGLDRSEAYAKFASSPDMMFARNDLMAGLSRAGQGLGPQSYGSTGTPHQKTYSDFEAIAGPGGSLSSGSGASSTGSNSAGGGSSTTSATSASGDGGSGDGKDHRVTAATNVMKAAGMSEDYGTDENDQAALDAISSIYKMKRPGSYERLRPGQQAAFSAGLSRLGYWAPDALADMQSASPGQRSVRAA